jgi:AP-3 complex subunit delta-1
VLQLFRFIDADLNAFRPKISSLDLPDDNVNGFAPEDDLHFPKSLYLIQPLSSSYQLNPVAKVAQASVPVPEGLDLDAWIVHPPEDLVQDVAELTDRKKKSKNGKGKGTSGEKKNSKKKRKDDDGELIALASPEVEVETAEERAERERVRQYFFIPSRLSEISNTAQG